jgi:hypothetical protein
MLFNFFKKKPKKEQPTDQKNNSYIYYEIDENSNVNIIAHIKDLQEETITDFAKLVVDVNYFNLFLDTINAILDGFEDCDKPELHEFFLAEVTKALASVSEKTKSFVSSLKDQEDPCIKPSDML